MGGDAPSVLTESGDVEDQPSNSSSNGPVLAAQETRLVNLSKLLVAVVVVVLAFLIGIVTHTYLLSEEGREYEEQFNAIADEIISITHIRSKSVFDNLESVGVSLTAQARAVNAQWPFVVFQDFQVEGMISNQITGANTLTIHPLVKDEDRDEWERFSVEAQGWVADAHVYDDQVHPVLYERNFFNDTVVDRSQMERGNTTQILPSIWTIDGNGKSVPVPAGASDVYTPFWQRAPAADFSPSVNRDLQSLDIFTKVIQGMIDTDHPVMTSVTDATFLKEKYDRRFAADEKEKPHIYLLSPIYDTLFANRTAVGFLSALFRFDNFFINILPEKETGIIVVLDGSCGDTYSYVVNGHEAEFIGAGNLADPKFEHMRRDFDIAPFAMLEETEDETYCQYSARIYPSDEWKSTYFTDKPISYAFAVVSCFVVTSIVFLLYDCLVQKRQDKVMDSATKTNKIVSELYPATVRDRMMDEMKAAEEAKAKGHGRDFRDESVTTVSVTGITSLCETSETIFGSQPIADLFPAVTVLFGDLVGFTAWSSVRDPNQVFTLLETIYHAFDVCARRRRVFKVETIGDCYVACAGLPVPRDDHATVMARFAHDCRSKMNALVGQLELLLGPGTSNLTMRIGLHSGPVTAGVLRGDKGRFQLFGDTVNTAARMESTGLKNRIHLSQDTADYLIQAGKEKWVVPRDEKVVAKGKGELQTFWLNARGGSEFDDGSAMTGDSTTAFPSSDSSAATPDDHSRMARIECVGSDVCEATLASLETA